MAVESTIIYPQVMVFIGATAGSPARVSVGQDTLSYGTTTALGSTLNAGQTMILTSGRWIRTAGGGAVFVERYETTATAIGDASVEEVDLSFEVATQAELVATQTDLENDIIALEETLEAYSDAAALSGAEVAASYTDTAVAPRSVSGSDTFVLADRTRTVLQTGTGVVAMTIPPNVTVAFEVGTVLSVVKTGSGTNAITMTAGAGVTVNGAGGLVSITAQHAQLSAVQVSANSWTVAASA